MTETEKVYKCPECGEELGFVRLVNVFRVTCLDCGWEFTVKEMDLGRFQSLLEKAEDSKRLDAMIANNWRVEDWYDTTPEYSVYAVFEQAYLFGDWVPCPRVAIDNAIEQLEKEQKND